MSILTRPQQNKSERSDNMLLSRRQRRSIYKLVRFTFRTSFKLIAFISSCIVTLMIFNVSIITKAIKYIKNHNHFKNIDYTYPQIQKLILDMDGRQFELFCEGLYKALGYKVKCIPAGNDYGRDLILNGNIFVECKHYTGVNMIGREICQKLIGSMEAFDVTEGIVITTGKVHSNAYEYASRLKYKNLVFITLNDIMNMINQIDVDKIPHIMERSFAPTDEDTINYMEEKFSRLQNSNKFN